ncbi:serine/threonine-protein phosphatase [Candidatus Peregrinibacteria bacterium]|nr:serine/threonine-protein phosphatase [Candidatus Peregrinibacteria bacterium]MBT4631858.1 serine/threonine-protein phosphatase [Candidatus Peregrinibacteria bacterium]MBT5516427.1 serine/threonine-protein phosphatase [Candidatus Peregrinibacteria bacterium]MBT5824221.1 serine/threonine-protein phosphatase [Candidatus Peregrinibacteria bacterium]
MKALLTGKVYRKIMTSKQDEIGIMAHFFNEVTRNLETISSDFRSHSRIKKELNVAQQIQMDLLPEKPPEIPGLEITAKTRPASEIGGDTFDFFVDDKKALMYIGDSTGHGVPAGIVMVMVDTLIETFIDMKDDIVDIIISLNKYLKPHLQTTMFMTMILLEWIPETKTINWVGAGHEYLIHVKTSENKISAIAAGGIAVGMLADNTALVKKQTFQLVENDFIVLYSDGINEAKNVNGEIYTLERLLNLIKSHVSPEVSSNDVFEAIANDVSRFMAGHPQEDDMTLMVIKQSEAKLPAPASAVSS